MKPRTILLCFFSSLLIFCTISCNQKNDTVSPIKTCDLINIKDYYGISTTLSYDTEQRLSTLLQFDSTGKEIRYRSYTYVPGQINISNRDESYISTIFLNADGTAESQVSITYYTYGSPQYETTSYTYDSEGHNINKVQVTKIGTTSTTIVYTYTYTDGNLTKVTAPYYLNERTYTTIKNADSFTNNVSDNYLPGVFGKGSKNLPASSVDYFINATSTFLYSYETNTAGYVTKETADFNNIKTLITYKNYQCK